MSNSDAGDRYNSLPDDGDQRTVDEKHLEEILKLILVNGVEDKFGVHLIHGHLNLNKNEVMLGKALDGPDTRGIWTRPTNICDLEPKRIHGHIFALNSSSQFIPYEYRHGPPPAICQDDDMFIIQFRAYLLNNGLADLLGLQVLPKSGVTKMQEFDLSGNSPEGAIMLNAEDTQIDSVYRVTGWSAVTDNATGTIELKGNDVHSPMKNGNHRVFKDSKIGDERSLIRLLRDYDILR